ncbi:hypothetical protein MKEN_00605100 [Mycena kentingensis (nom. inval.)]|nr:hypothetical protein MKEN_00605100 [Mycena kentingensis (nom. inval.)]
MPLALFRARSPLVSTLLLVALLTTGVWLVGRTEEHALQPSTERVWAESPVTTSRSPLGRHRVPKPTQVKAQDAPQLSMASHVPVDVAEPSHSKETYGKAAPYLFPVNDPEHTHPWTLHNQGAMQSLFACLESVNCAQNQTKVILLASYHFRGALSGWDGGEDLWARSTIIALGNLGYTILYATTPHLQRTIQLYQTMPNLISMVLLDVGDMMTCFNDDSTLCVKSHDNPDGIPAHKIFTFNWWEDSAHPLDERWDLSPEAYPGSKHTYLGYSIEPSCAQRTFVPHSERAKQVYVMGKNGDYFAAGNRAWEPHTLERAAEAIRPPSVDAGAGAEAQVRFLVGIREDGLPAEFAAVEKKGMLKDLGRLSPEEFYSRLSHSVALLGMGSPRTSPSAYDALCLGVAFINPVHSWDRDYPTDRTRWVAQHETLKYLDPPYVYNVFVNDDEGFVRAVKEATERPFSSFIPKHMRFPAIEERLGKIINTDWKGRAEELMEQRRKGGPGKVFLL